MSDESTPLRIKPRLKPENEPGTPAAEIPPPGPPPAGGEEAAPKIRLRPKLSVNPEPAAAAATPEAPATPPPPPGETPRLKPRFSVAPQPAAPDSPAEGPPPSEPAGGEEAPKFKLKFKAAGAEAEPPVVPAAVPLAGSPPERAVSPGVGLAGDTLVGAPVVEAAPAKPKMVQLRLSEDQLPPLEPGEVKVPKPPVPKRAITTGVIGAVAAFLVIFAGSAFFTHRLRELPAPAPKPKPVVLPPPKPVEPEVVVEKEPAETVEGTAAKKGPTGPRVRHPVPIASKTPSMPASSTTSIGGGVSATTSDDVAATDASPAFRSWVAGAKIGGVFQGASPRVLINGRTVRAGTMVDESLSIVFDSVDTANKMIIFKDNSGAVVSRRY